MFNLKFLNSTLFILIASLITCPNISYGNPIRCEELIIQLSNPLPIQEIYNKAREIVAKDEVVGLSITLFNESGVIASKGFGHEKRLGETEVSAENSQFRWNSNSKLLVAASVAKLVSQGVLNLEDSILTLTDVKFVQFLLRNESENRLQKWKKIKIKHLLLHQAGISKDLPGARVFWNSFSVADNALPTTETLLRGLLDIEFIFEPGKTEGAIKYSNIGLNLLARIVEDSNPQNISYQEFVKRNFFEPFGMKDSVYDVPSEASNLCCGYGTRQLDGQYLEIPHILDVGTYDGAIGISSTSEDMAKFGRELLKASRFQPNRIFESASVAEYFLTPPSENSFISPGRIMGPGIFWRFRPIDIEKPETLWVGHTGLGYGMESVVLVNPAHNVGVAIASNTQDKTFPAFDLWNFIAEKLAENSGIGNKKEGHYWRHLKKVTRRLKEAENKVQFTPIHGETVSKKQLEKFAGSYFADNSIQGPVKNFTVKEDDDGVPHLYFELIPGEVEFRMIPQDISNGIFRIEKVIDLLFHAERVEFIFDNSGNVTGVIVAQVKELNKIN